ncbi:uncharacterized protein SCHCODRAFT_02747016 [Schizophyllum commune H4-8]|nr:uncharacterized protein SCHCODRAFT_02747016 [Schizophyllum commune H4-8]KAI5895766.1 hypothetical protein SCHCODRAFT_02747016 [Schizophyllum commune H4-8]
MHAALRTAELRAIIFKQLPPRPLAALASTCKEFSTAALETLWHELNDLRPILMLLPQSVLEDTSSLHISPGDVDRIRYYGPFVRRLTVGSEPYFLTPEGLGRIIIALGGDALFPKLTHLQYHGPSAYAPHLYDLISPTLLRLAVQISVSDASDADEHLGTEITTLLAPKTRKLRNVKEFSLTIDRKVALLPVTNILAGWNGLQMLSLTGQIKRDVLDAVIRLPELRSLALHCHTEDSLPKLNYTLDKSLELPLRHLNMCVYSFVSASNFPGSLPGGTRLELSKLHVEGYYDACELEQFCRIIPPFSLPDPPITLDDFAPLLAFNQLCNLTITVPTTLDIADNDLRAMAQAWPHIRTLRLRGTLPSTTRCTLEGLVHLARNCKRLELITIALSSSTVAIPRARPDDAHHALHDLDVLNSPIDPGEVTAAAVFLAMHFPQLRRIVACPPHEIGDAAYERSWDAVMESIPTLVSYARICST